MAGLVNGIAKGPVVPPCTDNQTANNSSPRTAKLRAKSDGNAGFSKSESSEHKFQRNMIQRTGN